MKITKIPEPQMNDLIIVIVKSDHHNSSYRLLILKTVNVVGVFF